MSTDLVRLDLGAMEQIARHLANSGQFGRSTPEQAFVAVLAGQELGIPPFASITGIHVIQGKPVIGAGLLAARVKASGRYDYRVKLLDDERCLIAFFEGGDHVGDSEFSMDEARRAGLASKDVWKQYPRNMLFARAMSNGVAWFAPDVTAGRVYTEDEVDEQAPPAIPARSDFIDAEAVEVTNGREQFTAEQVKAFAEDREPDPATVAERAAEVPRPDAESVRKVVRGLNDAQKGWLKGELESRGFKARTQGQLVEHLATTYTLDEWNALLARVPAETFPDDLDDVKNAAAREEAPDETERMFSDALAEVVGKVPAYGEPGS